jgi:2,3-bisphosphoglycerate-independent phosphoglycerate mutase
VTCFLIGEVFSMKYIVVLGDGMADEPIAELGGKTPLGYARTPNMDRMAREGASGMLRTIPDGYEAGSDIANMAVLGYAPEKYYTGRGPLEALSMGVDLSPEDVAYRCNLVTVENDTMVDFSSGHISSDEGKELFTSLQPAIHGVMVRAGVSYRNLLVVHGGKGATSTPPHDIVGQGITPYLPKGSDAGLLLQCMEKSRSVFDTHPVNLTRVAAGKRPATQIWPWSGGRKPAFPLFEKKYGKKGGVISAVDLLNGIARCAGMEVITVPGATGYLDTDYEAKGRYALEAIRRLDFVYLHIEAPDEAGHLGSIEEKVKAIEKVDEVVGMILDGFDGVLAVLPDHPTPIRAKTHTRDPVPFVVRGKGKDALSEFSENAARSGGLGMKNAVGFLDFLFS